MPDIVIELTDIEAMVLEHIALDPYDYIDNVATWQARIVTDEIVAMEVARMINDPNVAVIPSDREQIVRQANLVPAAQRQ